LLEGSARVAVARGDVLRTSACIPDAPHAIEGREPHEVGVIEVAPRAHIERVVVGDLIEQARCDEGRNAHRHAVVVDQRDEVGLFDVEVTQRFDGRGGVLLDGSASKAQHYTQGADDPSVAHT
jgi:hypothetical protein